MTTDPAIAQGLVDALAAVALAARLSLAIRPKVAVPSQIRPALLFAALALFYACRSCAQLFGLPLLGLASAVVMALTPIWALLLAEAMLRRHAPTFLKLGICLAALAEVAWLFTTAGRPPADSWGLAFDVLGALLALTFLLLFRRRAGLSPHENGTIDAVLLAAAGLLPLGVTDFLSWWPVGLSGLGATLLAWLSQKSLGTQGASRHVALDVAVPIVLGLGFSLGLCDLLSLKDWAVQVQVTACSVGLVLSMACVLAAMRARDGTASGLALRQALARAGFDSLANLLNGLADQPLLKGMQVLQGAGLADFDADHLRRALHAGVVGARDHGQASEQLTELMRRYGASHAVLLRAEPLAIGLLALPELGGTVETETDLALLSRLAVSIPSHAKTNAEAA